MPPADLGNDRRPRHIAHGRIDRDHHRMVDHREHVVEISDQLGVGRPVPVPSLERIEVQHLHPRADGDARLRDRRLRRVLLRQIGVHRHAAFADLRAHRVETPELVRRHRVGFAVAPTAEIDAEPGIDLAAQVLAHRILVERAVGPEGRRTHGEEGAVGHGSILPCSHSRTRESREIIQPPANNHPAARTMANVRYGAGGANGRKSRGTSRISVDTVSGAPEPGQPDRVGANEAAAERLRIINERARAMPSAPPTTAPRRG